MSIDEAGTQLYEQIVLKFTATTSQRRLRVTDRSFPVHTYPDSFLSANILFLRIEERAWVRGCYAYRPHVSNENKHRNRKRLKTLSKVETFENQRIGIRVAYGA